MDETRYTDVTSQEYDKKRNKKWGSPCSILRHNADKYGYLGPFGKTARSPKLDKQERFFRWCMRYRTEFHLNVLFIHLSTRKNAF